MDIGKKIRELRILNQLTQQELADRCELSKGFISQLENNLTSPSIATLTDLLQCLGTNLRDFFSDERDDQVVFRQKDYFEKDDADEGVLIRWIVPNAQRNMMEPIWVQLEPGAQTETDVPHDGEEFGYCLSGTLMLTIGSSSYAVHRGETFYYRPDQPHYIRNNGTTPARFIWVTTPPNF